jgi:hypothetical protein
VDTVAYLKRPPGAQPHWNFGACISYVQLMKTMPAIAGINCCVPGLPKTTQWLKLNVDWDDLTCWA